MAAAVRALAIVCALAGIASADMEMRPPPVHGCRHGASWNDVDKCLGKLGKHQVLRDLGTAKIMQLQLGETQTEILVYVAKGTKWQLGGVHEQAGDSFELLAANEIVIGKHTGYRIDLGEVTHMGGSPDGVQHGSAVFMVRHVLLCSGESWSCTDIVVACDVFLRGAALWSFRGAMTIADNQVTVAGSRTNAGPFCAVAEREYLGWPQ